MTTKERGELVQRIKNLETLLGLIHHSQIPGEFCLAAAQSVQFLQTELQKLKADLEAETKRLNQMLEQESEGNDEGTATTGRSAHQEA
jgi:hypothetical protein